MMERWNTLTRDEKMWYSWNYTLRNALTVHIRRLSEEMRLEDGAVARIGFQSATVGRAL